jgi:uroporphyrin-III C-methyltransferase
MLTHNAKNTENRNTGKVILAGAGPGDADLITVKLQRSLSEATVIIYDRLVNPAIITNNAPADALLIMTGKQGYNDSSFSQEAINNLLLDHAKQGKTVLRLKGGDVAFFSNVLDELQCLLENEIPYEIIPGITAAAGASAYAGIPLTARGYAQGVQLLTYNPNSHFSPEKWKQLAACSDTLVFYMAAKNVTGVAELLLRYHKKGSTPLAVIEQATTQYQQVHLSDLTNCSRDFEEKTFSSPSLLIIGDVVKLHELFRWRTVDAAEGSVFNELATG